MLSETCAVVVTYQPDLELLAEVLAASAGELGGLVVVENGPAARVPRELLPEGPRCGVVPLEENLGLAEGQNRGIAWAREQGFRRVLLLDDDSLPTPGMATRLGLALDALEAEGERVAGVAPAYRDPRTGARSYFVRLGWLGFRRLTPPPEAPPLRVDLAISSGLLLPMAALDALGEMDPGLFVDHVDTDWCLRARAAGWSLFGVPEAEMLHRLGNQPVRFWLGRWRQAPRYPPVRHYYNLRNSLLLYRRPHASWRWIACDLVRVALRVGFYQLAGPRRLATLGMTLRGLVDGVRGRGGPA